MFSFGALGALVIAVSEKQATVKKRPVNNAVSLNAHRPANRAATTVGSSVCVVVVLVVALNNSYAALVNAAQTNSTLASPATDVSKNSRESLVAATRR